jgi:hypothetical protein
MGFSSSVFIAPESNCTHNSLPKLAKSHFGCLGVKYLLSQFLEPINGAQNPFLTYYSIIAKPPQFMPSYPHF